MDNLKHLEGKAVRSIEQNNSGLNSYLIIKFTDDSKLNISGYPHGDKGVAQLDIELEDIKIPEIKNRKIETIEEEFDGSMDKLVIKFKKGGRMVIGAFNSKEDSTAGLETTVYVENKKKLVAESIDENEYKDGRFGDYIMNSPQYEEEEPDEENKNNEKDMKKFVSENLNEFSEWYRDNDDEYDVEDNDEIENDEEVEIVDAHTDDEVFDGDDIVEEPIDADIQAAIQNELSVPEFSRAALEFRLKGSREFITGIPMTLMSNGSSVLFKTEDGLRKVALSDIIVESSKPTLWVGESLEDY